MAMTTLGPADIFSVTGDEMRALIDSHIVTVRDCRARAVARVSLEEAAEAAAVEKGGRFFSTAKEVFQSTVAALDRRIEECEFTRDHLVSGDYRMSAAHLLGFRSAYRPLVIDTESAIVSAEQAPHPESQAERSMKEALVQVPRLVLPSGVMTR